MLVVLIGAIPRYKATRLPLAVNVAVNMVVETLLNAMKILMRLLLLTTALLNTIPATSIPKGTRPESQAM